MSKAVLMTTSRNTIPHHAQNKKKYVESCNVNLKNAVFTSEMITIGISLSYEQS